ncbi:hypothetical protein A9995_07420 [Erythrobacter sp. QSSC1-22B]|uniref:hypothetical protein n=1 Tax=Erythrobacter sp. QSSC1-22B TaxID=1860125 RepID=UPI00080586D5|nr:hypothetical protein [Erythrobacter sp. QSSC1-22B]OBX19566.1 hypothetical protein A9995_07420 [Erythrobacter sp. QSSC1-22B]
MQDWSRTLVSEALLIAREIAGSPAMRRVALVLLPYIGVLVGLDVAGHYGSLTDAELPAQFQISQDHSLGEYLEYAFTGTIAVLLLVLWRRTAAKAYLANALLFAWLTADNAFEFHEGFGHSFASVLTTPADWPLRANDIGEAMLFGFVGLLWAAGLGSSLHAARLRPVIHALILAGCVVGAAFFGVVVDMDVVWGAHSEPMLELLTWLEDGGEFAMICLAFFLTVGIFDSEKRHWPEEVGKEARKGADRRAAP